MGPWFHCSITDGAMVVSRESRLALDIPPDKFGLFHHENVRRLGLIDMASGYTGYDADVRRHAVKAYPGGAPISRRLLQDGVGASTRHAASESNRVG
jgi:alpha-L-fucosidase